MDLDTMQASQHFKFKTFSIIKSVIQLLSMNYDQFSKSNRNDEILPHFI